MVTLKTREEINILKEGGQILASTLRELKEIVEAGYKNNVSTLDIDRQTEKILREKGAKAAFKNYHGFPGSICISINDEVVHGIPKKDRYFREGDIVTLDLGVIHRDLYTDAAISFTLGDADEELVRLSEETKNALMEGIGAVQVGSRIGDVGATIEEYVEKLGYGIVRSYAGHGVGYKVHEEPQVPNYGKRGTGEEIRSGMVLAIEPMVTLGGEKVFVDKDGWTVKTADGCMVAQWEHTVVATKDGPVILTE